MHRMNSIYDDDDLGDAPDVDLSVGGSDDQDVNLGPKEPPKPPLSFRCQMACQACCSGETNHSQAFPKV